MSIQAEFSIWRTPRTFRGFAWLLIASLAALGGYIAGAGIADEELGLLDRVIGPLVAATLFGLGAFLIYRSFILPYLAATPNRVIVRNPIRNYLIRWADVHEFIPTDFGLAIRTNDAVIRAWAIPKSRIALARGHRTRADEIASALALRAAQITHRRPESLEPTREDLRQTRKSARRAITVGTAAILAGSIFRALRR